MRVARKQRTAKRSQLWEGDATYNYPQTGCTTHLQYSRCQEDGGERVMLQKDATSDSAAAPNEALHAFEAAPTSSSTLRMACQTSRHNL